ncbi:hypothetical protein Actkin_01846 [Actinokineospora sp. UTMC 2448]|nr:hypothetical protein Actkin_01846 [Actinokineospora sp. UTMC 2448]
MTTTRPGMWIDSAQTSHSRPRGSAVTPMPNPTPNPAARTTLPRRPRAVCACAGPTRPTTDRWQAPRMGPSAAGANVCPAYRPRMGWRPASGVCVARAGAVPWRVRRSRKWRAAATWSASGASARSASIQAIRMQRSAPRADSSRVERARPSMATAPGGMGRGTVSGVCVVSAGAVARMGRRTASQGCVVRVGRMWWGPDLGGCAVTAEAVVCMGWGPALRGCELTAGAVGRKRRGAAFQGCVVKAGAVGRRRRETALQGCVARAGAVGRKRRGAALQGCVARAGVVGRRRRETTLQGCVVKVGAERKRWGTALQGCIAGAGAIARERWGMALQGCVVKTVAIARGTALGGVR